ncbi:MAG: hypothetical protein H6828_13915 [Planctomycetes bacterium]|nr:hypothetical protein [Planctomycetota bacterium]
MNTRFSLLSISFVALSIASAASTQGGYTCTELCSTTTNSVGPGVVLGLDGAVGVNPERAVVTGGPSGKFGALIYGKVCAQPAIPWGNGSLCITPFHPSTGRYTVSNFSNGGTAEVFLNSAIYPQTFPFLPGETGYVQYLYRDVQGWNLSNALQVTMAP